MSTNAGPATKTANRIDPNKEPSIEIRGNHHSTGKRLVKKVKKATSPFIRTDYIRRQYLKTKSKFKRDSTKKNENKHENNIKKEDLGNSDDEYDEFPIRAIKFDDIENVKTNILKFQTNKTINVEKDFHLPVRLHRKDTRNLQFQLTRAEIVQRQKEIIEYKKKLMEEENKELADQEEKASEDTNAPLGKSMIQKMLENHSGNDVKQGVDEESVEQPKSLRPAEAGKVIYDGKEGFIDSELNMADNDSSNLEMFADVAPDGGARVRRGGWFGRRKTRQLKKFDEHAKKLRFEEFYPWVLEDYDGYNTWVGTYEAGNSDHYVMFSVEKDGSFTMLPCDKVYRFTARSQFATLTIEEAEKRFEKKRQSVPRWLMKHLDDIGTTTTRYDRTMRKLKGVDGDSNAVAEDDGDVFRKDNSDNEIDYDDEFQDDEEAPIVDGNDQDNKETEQRIKKEMLQANAMGLRNDNDHEVDEEEEEEQNKVEDKSIKNALKKTDLGVLYDTDDEDENDPYLSKSELEDEDSKEAKVKAQDKSDAEKLTSPDKKVKKVKKPKAIVKKYKNNIIVIKTTPEILKRFPLGEWYPKTDSDKTLSVSQNGTYGESTDGPSEKSTNSKLAPELTKQDIVDIISSNPGKLTLKDLIKELKLRVVMNAENKNAMKVLIKQIVKLNNGFLELVQSE